MLVSIARSCSSSAPTFTSATDVTTLLTILAMLRTTQLFYGSLSSLVKKNCPLALLLALGSVRYEASLCTINIMLLLLVVSITSGLVAR